MAKNPCHISYRCFLDLQIARPINERNEPRYDSKVTKNRKSMHLSFSFSSAMPKFPGIEVPGNSDFQCAYLPSSTRSLTGEPSVFNSHWHLPHDWYWLAPIRRELPSVNIYKSTHLTHSPWLLLSAISLSHYQLKPSCSHKSSCLVFVARSFDNLHLFMLLSWSRQKAQADTVKETQMPHLQKALPSNFMLKRFSQRVKNVVLPNLFCSIAEICREGTRLISVTALRARAAVSRLISSGHKAAALVFLAGGFTLWTLGDRGRGGEYWPCLPEPHCRSDKRP